MSEFRVLTPRWEKLDIQRDTSDLNKALRDWFFEIWFYFVDCPQTDLINDTKFPNSPNVQGPSSGPLFQWNRPSNWHNQLKKVGHPEICYILVRISGNHLGCVPSYVRLRQFYKPINFTQMYAIRAELDKTRSYFESEICNYSSELETKTKRTDLWQLPVVIYYLQKLNKLELFRPWLFRLIKQL